MATMFMRFTYFLIIISYYFHDLTASKSLHLYYIRHVESVSNAGYGEALFKRDSRITPHATNELQCIYNGTGGNFGNKFYDKIETLLSNINPRNLSFEASTLRRAQLTVLTAWHSLISFYHDNKAQIAENAGKKVRKYQKMLQKIKNNKKGNTKLWKELTISAKKRLKAAGKRLIQKEVNAEEKKLINEKLEEWQLKEKNIKEFKNLIFSADFNIVKDLQEVPGGKLASSTSKFERMAIKDDVFSCDGYKEYLDEGLEHAVKATPNIKSTIFSGEFSEEHICGQTHFIKAARWETNAGSNAIGTVGRRFDDYGKRLREQIDSGMNLIIIGGHGNWFNKFFKKFKALRGYTGNYNYVTFEKERDHLTNGEMIHLVVEPHNYAEENGEVIKSIKIVSGDREFKIPQKKKNEEYQCD